MRSREPRYNGRDVEQHSSLFWAFTDSEKDADQEQPGLENARKWKQVDVESCRERQNGNLHPPSFSLQKAAHGI